MRTLTKETCQILKFNQKNALLFEVLYRLLTGPLYLFLLNKGLKWSLKMAGYSYLTAGNIGYFLLKHDRHDSCDRYHRYPLSRA